MVNFNIYIYIYYVDDEVLCEVTVYRFVLCKVVFAFVR